MMRNYLSTKSLDVLHCAGFLGIVAREASSRIIVSGLLTERVESTCKASKLRVAWRRNAAWMTHLRAAPAVVLARWYRVSDAARYRWRDLLTQVRDMDPQLKGCERQIERDRQAAELAGSASWPDLTSGLDWTHMEPHVAFRLPPNALNRSSSPVKESESSGGT